MTAIRAIMFDLDDTLFPERQYAFSGFAAVAAAFKDRLGAPYDLARRMGELFDTPDRGRIFNVVLEELGVTDPGPLVADMIDAYRRHTPRISLHPDADDALTRLRGHARLGLISDGFAVAQHAKIDALGLRARLDEIIVTDDWGRGFWKPHPRAFEEMARRLKVHPEACTYVADNPAKDFIAPNALGWQTVFIRRPDGVHAANTAPPGGEPQRTVTSLSQL